MDDIRSSIHNLITQPHYPCVAAIQSYHKGEYQIGTYGKLGSDKNWKDLRKDLLLFMEEQKKSSSIYLSFWAIFEKEDLSEESFEKKLWEELSFLTSDELKEKDWPKNISSDPQDMTFGFCIGGEQFFVVGLHPRSSRKARQFPYPILIFNVFSQFEALQKLGQYEPMKKLNRQRDEKFQGSINPMAGEYADKWESIQFSGKKNSSEWKCPFHFLKNSEKI